MSHHEQTQMPVIGPSGIRYEAAPSVGGGCAGMILPAPPEHQAPKREDSCPQARSVLVYLAWVLGMARRHHQNHPKF